MTAGFMRRLEQALAKEQLARLRSSIGLDLGTPHAEETAISTPRDRRRRQSGNGMFLPGPIREGSSSCVPLAESCSPLGNPGSRCLELCMRPTAVSALPYRACCLHQLNRRNV